MSIVAVKNNGGRIIMVGDSQVTLGEIKVNTSGFQKLRRIKGMIVGCVGSVEEASLFYYFINSSDPPNPTEDSVLDYMVRFYKGRDELNNKLIGEEELSRNRVLLAVGGKCFRVDSTFVYEVKPGYHDAIGCEYAAAIYMMDNGISPEKTVNSICDRNIFCSKPIIKYMMEVSHG